MPESCSSVLGTVDFRYPTSPCGEGLWQQTGRSRVLPTRPSISLVGISGGAEFRYDEVCSDLKNPIWAFHISFISIKPSALLTHLYLFWVLSVPFRERKNTRKCESPRNHRSVVNKYERELWKITPTLSSALHIQVSPVQLGTQGSPSSFWESGSTSRCSNFSQQPSKLHLELEKPLPNEIKI